MCQHLPLCPPAQAANREAARTIVSRPEQGWSLLCNGVVMFEDRGTLLPDGTAVAPRRWAARHPLASVARHPLASVARPPVAA